MNNKEAAKFVEEIGKPIEEKKMKGLVAVFIDGEMSWRTLNMGPGETVDRLRDIIAHISNKLVT
jgi:hypothetical protein